MLDMKDWRTQEREQEKKSATLHEQISPSGRPTRRFADLLLLAILDEVVDGGRLGNVQGRAVI